MNIIVKTDQTKSPAVEQATEYALEYALKAA